MKRLAACLGVLVLLFLTAACGTESEASSQPSVAVKAGPTLEFEGRDVYVFTLSPSGRPSGTLALKSVAAGSVTTLDQHRFVAMEATGSVALEVSPRGIDVAWDTPPVGASLAGGPVAFPAGSQSGMVVWTSSATYGPADTAGEQVFWVQGRYLGEPPDSDSDAAGAFLDTVSRSAQQPARTSYCLTISVDAP